MEIIIDKPGSIEYYGEVQAAVMNYKKLRDNPERKLRSPTTPALVYAGISVIFMVIFSYLFLNDLNNAVYFCIIVLFSVTLILSAVYYILILRRVVMMNTNNLQKKLVIEDGYVEMTIGGEKTRLEMSEIKNIIINRYSIIFLGKNPSSKLMAVNRFYEDEIVESIRDKNLIVDNSAMYGKP